MRFSLTYPLVAHPHNPEFLEKANLLRYAQTAEAAGFDGIGFTEHPVPSERWLSAGGHDALDPYIALAFIAAVTERIRLIPNIAVLPYRNPFLTAKTVASLDVLSGGRFTLAVATGYLKAEYRALGVAFAERNELFDEAIAALKAIWSSDDLRFEGRHFEALGQTANPKPVQRPHPPIWIGGNSRRSRRRVAEYGQGWAPFPAPRSVAATAKTPALETPEDLAAMLDDLWEQLEKRGRKRSEIDVTFGCSAGGAPAAADFDAAAHLEGIDALARLGVTWVTVGTPGDDLGHALETLERYGEQVIAPHRSA